MDFIVVITSDLFTMLLARSFVQFYLFIQATSKMLLLNEEAKNKSRD